MGRSPVNDPTLHSDKAPDLPAVFVLLDQAAHHLTELVAGLAQITEALGPVATTTLTASTDAVLRNIDQALGQPTPPDTRP